MKQKAFSLLEVIVTMAIIGAILGMAVFGIAAAQRNRRDTVRKNALNEIKTGIEDFNANNNRNAGYIGFVPSSGTGTSSTAAVVIYSTAVTDPNACKTGTLPGCVYVPLKDSAVPAAAGAATSTTGGVVDMSGQKGASDTSRYCFAFRADGYALGVVLENKQWHYASTSIAQPECGSVINN